MLGLTGILLAPLLTRSEKFKFLIIARVTTVKV